MLTPEESKGLRVVSIAVPLTPLRQNLLLNLEHAVC